MTRVAAFGLVALLFFAAGAQAQLHFAVSDCAGAPACITSPHRTNSWG